MSVGVGVQLGALGALVAIPYGMLTYLHHGTLDGANGYGASFTLSGFSHGFTHQDLTLTSSGSIGFSLTIGVAIGLPVPGYTNVPDNRNPS